MIVFCDRLRVLGRKLIPVYARWDLTTEPYSRFRRGSVRYVGAFKGRIG